MKNQSTMFSSKTPNWGTPKSLLELIKKHYNIELDTCARNSSEAVCERFYSPSDDGLMQPWDTDGYAWCNPPYGRQIIKWIKKAKEESLKGNKIIMLIPARTDTKWFHEYIFNSASEIHFIKGRLKFIDLDKARKSCAAPFPSMIVVYDKNTKTQFYNQF